MADAVSPEYVIPKKVGTEKPDGTPRGNHKGRPRGERTNAYKLMVWQRRSRMAAMCADGMMLSAIADEFGVSASYVSQEIQKMVEDLQNQALETMGHKIAREIQVLNMVQLEATIAWFESKEGKVTSVKRRKREIRSAFQKQSRNRAINTVKPINLVESGRAIRSQFASLFEDSPPVEDLEAAQPAPDPNAVPTRDDMAQIVQLPIETEEEYEREETSSGAPEFLRIILDCSDKRARLLGLYKGQEEGGYETYTNLTNEQRADRLTALVQDLRAAKAIVDSQQSLPPANGNGAIPTGTWQTPNGFESVEAQMSDESDMEALD
jgi:CRISPR/Cas system CMR-associated protein Cmr5 small subunit